MVAVNKIGTGAVVKYNGDFCKIDSISESVITTDRKKFDVTMQDIVSGNTISVLLSHDDQLEEVNFNEMQVEFLYFDDGHCFFLDIESLDTFSVDEMVVAHKRSYLKEGVVCRAMCSSGIVFNVELPQFLELMVSKISDIANSDSSGHSYATAILETGAEITVPSFIEVGDIVKVDPRQNEYIQRI